MSVIPSPSASGESTGKSSGGSSGAVIGGIIGGVAMALVIIVVLVVVIVWIRRSQSSKGKLADSNESIHGTYTHLIVIHVVIVLTLKMYKYSTVYHHNVYY